MARPFWGVVVMGGQGVGIGETERAEKMVQYTGEKVGVKPQD